MRWGIIGPGYVRHRYNWVGFAVITVNGDRGAIGGSLLVAVRHVIQLGPTNPPVSPA